jgi:hypothetical protein
MSIGHSINMALFLLTTAFAPSAAALPDLLLIGLKTNVGTLFDKKLDNSQANARSLPFSIAGLSSFKDRL